MKTRDFSVILATTVLALLVPDVASAQTPPSTFYCEGPFMIGNRWIPVSCYSDREASDFAVPSEPTDDRKNCNIKRPVISHLIGGVQNANLSSSSGGGGGAGGGGGGLSGAVSNAVGGLLH